MPCVSTRPDNGVLATVCAVISKLHREFGEPFDKRPWRVNTKSAVRDETFESTVPEGRYCWVRVSQLKICNLYKLNPCYLIEIDFRARL